MINPSECTIQMFLDEYCHYYRILLQLPLMEASKKGFTEFNHVALDGTIVKAHNSDQNRISKKETNFGPNTTKDLKLTLKSLKNSINPLKKIIDNKEMSDDEKLELLYDIRTQFKFTGQDKIPMNDIKSRIMKGKKGNFLVAYNVQSTVDYKTKLICALYVTQNPTDHYELPEVADKVINI